MLYPIELRPHAHGAAGWRKSGCEHYRKLSPSSRCTQEQVPRFARDDNLKKGVPQLSTRRRKPLIPIQLSTIKLTVSAMSVTHAGMCGSDGVKVVRRPSLM